MICEGCGESGGNGFGGLGGIAESFLQGSKFLFESSDGVADFRQSFEGHQLPCGFGDGSRWCSEIGLSAGHIPMHPGFGSNDRTVTQMHVVSNADLSGTDDIVTGGYGSGEPDLRDEEVVTTYVTVVADHDLVINASARADDSFTDFSAVDRCTGSDFHVVTDANDAEVWQSQMPAVDQSITEAVGTDDATGMDDHVITDVHICVEDSPGVQYNVIADNAAVTDDSSGMNIATVADFDISSDDRQRMHVGVGTDPC
jgi:hypothetical protein